MVFFLAQPKKIFIPLYKKKFPVFLKFLRDFGKIIGNQWYVHAKLDDEGRIRGWLVEMDGTQG